MFIWFTSILTIIRALSSHKVNEICMYMLFTKWTLLLIRLLKLFRRCSSVYCVTSDVERLKKIKAHLITRCCRQYRKHETNNGVSIRSSFKRFDA